MPGLKIYWPGLYKNVLPAGTIDKKTIDESIDKIIPELSRQAAELQLDETMNWPSTGSMAAVHPMPIKY